MKKSKTDLGVYLPALVRFNARTNKVITGFHISRTAQLADLYRESNSGLVKELSERESYYNNLPWHTKAWRFFFRPLYNLCEDVKEEINYRKEHTREPEDWKELFKKTSKRFKRMGENELAQYMKEDAMKYYLESREDKKS